MGTLRAEPIPRYRIEFTDWLSSDWVGGFVPESDCAVKCEASTDDREPQGTRNDLNLLHMCDVTHESYRMLQPENRDVVAIR
jgi:hypothetical protein